MFPCLNDIAWGQLSKRFCPGDIVLIPPIRIPLWCMESEPISYQFCRCKWHGLPEAADGCHSRRPSLHQTEDVRTVCDDQQRVHQPPKDDGPHQGPTERHRPLRFRALYCPRRRGHSAHPDFAARWIRSTIATRLQRSGYAVKQRRLVLPEGWSTIVGIHGYGPSCPTDDDLNHIPPTRNVCANTLAKLPRQTTSESCSAGVFNRRARVHIHVLIVSIPYFRIFAI